MRKSPNRALRIWLVIGLLAYVALPWYAIQDTAWYSVLPQILGGPETANGIVQALVHHRKWLLLGLIGLVIAAAGLSMPPGKAQGNWLLTGGLVGFLGLLISAFAIGSKGWSFAFLSTQFGELALTHQRAGENTEARYRFVMLMAASGTFMTGRL